LRLTLHPRFPLRACLFIGLMARRRVNRRLAFFRVLGQRFSPQLAQEEVAAGEEGLPAQF
jgi:hypothetical protein